MTSKKAFLNSLIALATITQGANAVFAQVSATAAITAAADGPNKFLYTINLHNTGTANIETFWFSWLPDFYDFLPSLPTVTNQPANWTSVIESGVYGNSIEFYNNGASSPIGPGQSSAAFQFTSPDSPTTLQGNSSFGLPITYSYVYSGVGAAPLVDPVSPSSVLFSIPITTVPEPSSIALAGIGLAVLIARRRRVSNTT